MLKLLAPTCWASLFCRGSRERERERERERKKNRKNVCVWTGTNLPIQSNEAVAFRWMSGLINLYMHRTQSPLVLPAAVFLFAWCVFQPLPYKPFRPAAALQQRFCLKPLRQNTFSSADPAILWFVHPFSRFSH